MKKLIFILLSLLISKSSWAGAVITYHGRILNDVGHAVESNNVTFRIRVYSPNPGKCLLYEETRTLSMVNSDGIFVIPIGDGTGSRTVSDPGISMEKIFSNDPTRTFDTTNTPKLVCNSISSYTPQVLDQRLLFVAFDDHSGVGEQELPLMDVNFVPFAVNSYDSQNVGGTPAGSILRLSSGTASPLTAANFTALLSLLDGTSSQYSKPNQLNGNNLPALTNGQVLGWNNGWTGVSASGTSSVSVTAPITNSGTASAPNISISQSSGSQSGFLSSTDWTNFNSKLSSALNSAYIWVGNSSNTASPVPASGDVSLNNAGAFTVTKIQNMPVSATTPNGAGQVLRYNGTTQYAANFLNLSDIHSGVTPGSTAFPSLGCTTKQTLTWISLNDTLSCATIGIDDTQLAFTTSRAANTVLAAPSGGAGSATFRTLTAADLPASGATGVYLNGGNSFGSTATLGTNDANTLTFKTSNTNQVTIAADGKVGVGTETPTFNFDLIKNQNANTVSSVANTDAGPLAIASIQTSSDAGGHYWGMQSTAGGAQAFQGTTAPGGSFYDIYNSSGDHVFRTTTAYIERLRITSAGNIGIGTATPSAALHLKAGTAAASTAPLKFKTGVNLTTPEVGAIEFDGSNLYFTDSTPARRTIATATNGNYTTVNSISNSGGNIIMAPNSTTGSVQVTSSTVSTGSSSGALVVSGGAGFSGDIYSAASINAATTMSALSSILTPQLYGSASASGDIKIDGTSHATKGNVLLASAGGKVGIGVGTVAAATGILEVGGTSSSTSFFYVNPTMTNAIVGSTAVNFNNTFAPSSAPAGSIYSNALSSTATTSSSNANANTTLNGISASASYSNASGTLGALNGAALSAMNLAGGIVSTARGGFASVNNVVGGTISNAVGLDTAISNGTGTITTAYALRANNITNAGTITTAHGLYVAKQNGAGITNSYGLYQADTGDKNYFAGNVGIGTTAPTAPLTLIKSSATTSGTVEEISVGLINSPATLSATTLRGGHFTVMHSGIGDNLSPLEGVTVDLINNSSAILSATNGFNANVSNLNLGTITTANGVNANVSSLGAGGKVTTARALNALVTAALGATITTSYEIYLDTNSSGTIGNQYGVYQNNANSKNYFAANVGIGTNTPGFKLEVNGTIAPSGNGTTDLGGASNRFKDIYATNSVINTSDIRQKKDIQTSDLGLNFINSLRPVSYFWKEGDQNLHYGVIAQETEKALAKAKQVSGRENEIDNVIVSHDKQSDTYGVRYTELISPIIKAVQELYSELTGTKTKIADLEHQEILQDRTIASINIENKKLKEENAAIKAYLCSKDSKAPFCR